MTLTHETLGSLVGSRRPTVTLALRKLTAEGALVAQESGWLLLEQPALRDGTAVAIAPPAEDRVAFGTLGNSAKRSGADPGRGSNRRVLRAARPS